VDPEKVHEILEAKFPGQLIEAGASHGQTWAVLKRDRLADICLFLKEDPSTKMDYLIDVTAVDWHPQKPRFEAVYHLHSVSHNHRLRLKVPLEEDDASVPSVSGVWLTANWHERETYDLFGIKFEGHPDLRRILLPDDWEGHPLRKDYPLQGTKWEFKPW